MPARMDGRASDAVLHDFALVTTYLPILGLTLRSSLLVSVLFWCLYTVRLPFQAVLMVASSLVYVDGLLLGSRFDRACGHLCLCALAVLTQQHERSCSDARSVALLINDLLWSVFASAEVVSSTALAHPQLPLHVKLVLGCVFACAHVLCNCAVVGLLEMLARGVLYYVLCSLIVLCAPFCPVERGADRAERGEREDKADRADRTDRAGRGASVLHLCAPVLFVHLYPLLASVLVIVGMHARLIYSTVSDNAAKAPQTHLKASQRTPPRAPPKAPQKAPHNTSQNTSQRPPHSDAEYPDLVLQLQAAKRAHGMV